MRGNNNKVDSIETGGIGIALLLYWTDQQNSMYTKLF